ncbi:hypothetical protein CK203_115558 [Vitis vinifera]|uniref:Uncharacterized protein n=1 Tax=Vitis vinifera TaxID=29760 RepID=A0A438CCR0_VITVI|nr:hypothetical protein CK203_115558 [Vitis vinifera]
MEKREREREKERERAKRERERKRRRSARSPENAEDKVLAGPWKSFRKGGFRVESKSFEVEVEEKKSRLQTTIVERKRGISS